MEARWEDLKRNHQRTMEILATMIARKEARDQERSQRRSYASDASHRKLSTNSQKEPQKEPRTVSSVSHSRRASHKKMEKTAEKMEREKLAKEKHTKSKETVEGDGAKERRTRLEESRTVHSGSMSLKASSGKMVKMEKEKRDKMEKEKREIVEKKKSKDRVQNLSSQSLFESPEAQQKLVNQQLPPTEDTHTYGNEESKEKSSVNLGPAAGAITYFPTCIKPSRYGLIRSELGTHIFKILKVCNPAVCVARSSLASSFIHEMNLVNVLKYEMMYCQSLNITLEGMKSLNKFDSLRMKGADKLTLEYQLNTRCVDMDFTNQAVVVDVSNRRQLMDDSLSPETEGRGIRLELCSWFSGLLAKPKFVINVGFQQLDRDFLKRLIDQKVEVCMSVHEKVKTGLLYGPSIAETHQNMFAFCERLQNSDEDLCKQVVAALYEVACYALSSINSEKIKFIRMAMKDSLMGRMVIASFSSLGLIKLDANSVREAKRLSNIPEETRLHLKKRINTQVFFSPSGAGAPVDIQQHITSGSEVSRLFVRTVSCQASLRYYILYKLKDHYVTISLQLCITAVKYIWKKMEETKLQGQQAFKYWEGRGIRMKRKLGILVVSYHPP